jgi:tripartite-type tricarboxylate transporter receptor subunit TctC
MKARLADLGLEPMPMTPAEFGKFIDDEIEKRAKARGDQRKPNAWRAVMKLPHRRRFLHLAAAAAVLPAVSRVASAQTYPVRPVHLIVGFAAGGTTDIIARLTGQWLSERLGRPFVIENRPGAGGKIAAEAVVNALPDGYTLLLASATHAYSATLYDNLSYDFIRDIVPVASIARLPFVMVVNPSLPAKNVLELIAYAKANPGKINYASPGNGTGQHIYGELFKMLAGVNMVHVPYKGNTPALTDLLGGQVQVLFSDLTSIQYIKDGRLRALAVTTAKRLNVLPDVPTVGESVPGYEASGWTGIGAPKNTPVEIIDKLNTEINAALADPTFVAHLADLGAEPFANSPADFRKFIIEYTEKWGKVIRAANIKAE